MKPGNELLARRVIEGDVITALSEVESAVMQDIEAKQRLSRSREKVFKLLDVCLSDREKLLEEVARLQAELSQARAHKTDCKAPDDALISSRKQVASADDELAALVCLGELIKGTSP